MWYEDFVVLGLAVFGAWISFRLTVGFDRSAIDNERLRELASLVQSQQAQMAELKIVIHHQRTTIELMAAQNSALKPEDVTGRASPTCISAPLSIRPWKF